jgi:hypothetical protein
MTGGEEATVRPPQLRVRANAGEARPSRVLGSLSGYYGRARGHRFNMTACGATMSLAALMAGGADISVARARKGKGRGGFYTCVEAVPPHRRGVQGLQHGRGAAATCGGADDQWGMAVRSLASAHRPRGTGLGLHVSVTASSA